MKTNAPLQWPLILGLASLVLLHPVAHVGGLQRLLGTPATPLLLVMVTAGVWIASVGLSNITRPVLSMVLASVFYGTFNLVLGFVAARFTGQGILQAPSGIGLGIGMVAVLLTSMFWGLVAGLLALLVQRLGGFHPQRNTTP